MRDPAGVCDDCLYDGPDEKEKHDMIDDEEDYFRHEVPMADVHHE